jgi:hypothetical protein
MWVAVSVGWAASEASSPAASTPASTQTVSLEFTEVPYSLLNLGVGVTPQARAFKQEPQLGRATLRRGRLNLQILGEAETPFVWDTAKARLYLDLNRNEDLTDDPAGVLSSAMTSITGISYRLGLFTNLQLVTQTESGRYRRTLDLNLTDSGGRVSAYAGLKSLWTGKASLDGLEYQIGAIVIGAAQGRPGSDPGYLLLRPWERRNEPFSVSDTSLNAFPSAKKLFLQSRLFDAECKSVRRGDELGYQLTLKEQPAELGELDIAGEFIQRAVLKDGARLVVLDAPKGTVRVPIGRYTDCQVRIGKDGSAAHPERSSPGLRRPLVVEKNKAVTLKGGGPLTNTVALSRRGNYLVLNYRLIGAGGENYQLGARDLNNPPRFAIYQGDTRIASGKFEFG